MKLGRDLKSPHIVYMVETGTLSNILHLTPCIMLFMKCKNMKLSVKIIFLLHMSTFIDIYPFFILHFNTPRMG